LPIDLGLVPVVDAGQDPIVDRANATANDHQRILD
jgi:hypothetical protein